MNLRYIGLNLDRELYGNEYGYSFFLHTRFISNYFSKEIRKYKFETDGSYKMISINASNDVVPPNIVPFDALKVNVLFDKMRYEKVKGTIDSDYYLELLDTGFKQACKFKLIPLAILEDLIVQFKNGDCKNEWLHKKKKFIEHDMEIILTCAFTTNYFQLVVTIKRFSTKKELIKGVVIRTEPDEVIFDKMFKDIYIDKNIVITEGISNKPQVVIDLKSAQNGILQFEIIGDKRIKKNLSYTLG